MQSRFVRLACLLLTLLVLDSNVLPAQTTQDAAAPTATAPGASPPATPADTSPAVAPAQAQNQPASVEPVGDANQPPRLAIPTPTDETPHDAAGPDTFMFDKNGQLQQVLNFPYEDFIKARDLLRGMGALAAPPYTIQSQKLTGKATGDRAELRIELKLLLHTDQQVRIPLGLNQAVLRTWKYEGDGQQFWNFEDSGDGYVCWLRGTAAKEHTIVMDIVIPVVKLGGETALRLGMPPSITSELTVDVDVPNAIGRVADDTNRNLAKRELANGTTQFSVAGVHGDFELAWRAADTTAPTIPTELTATGTLLVTIDGPSIQTDARLNVSSSGGEFEQFSLRLPIGATLLPSAPASYELTPVANQTAEDIALNGKLVDVKLSQKTSEPIEIRLRTEQTRSGKAVLKGVELAGFSVVGAARQWGYIATEVVGDWQVQWTKQQNVRRIERLPEAPVASDPVASFEYFGQPFVLTAQISPRTTRVRVEPEYVVTVGSNQVQLDGRLKYNIRGASEFALVVAVPGWEDVEVETSEGIDDKNVLREADQLTIPLKPARTGPFELRFKARRALTDNLVTFSLPMPRVTTQTTSTLVVLPEDNVELSPRIEELQGLLAEHVLPRIDLPVRQQEPLIYRGEPGAVQFVANLRTLPQAIEVDTLSHIEMDQENWKLDQKFTYRVDYEPVDHVTFLVPPGWVEGKKPEVSFEGQLLDESSISIQTITADEEPAKKTFKLRVRLPAPAHFGRFEVLVRYARPMPDMTTKQTASLEFPLFVPDAGVQGENAIVLSTATDIRVDSVSKPWQTSETDDPAWQPGIRYYASGRPNSIQLALELEKHSTPGTTVIDLAWIQSWFTSHERQDRVCYRFTTSKEFLDIQLPAGISPSKVQVTLDGFPVVAKVKTVGQLSIPLNNTTALRRRHLELQYRFGERDHRFGQLTLEAPQLLAGAWVQTTYWQVILPADEMLIVSPDNFVNEFTWGWNGLFQGRRPLYEQAELESLVGASAGLGVPASTNRYLFRDLGSPAELELSTARLSLIVFFSSVFVLSAGLSLIYLPVLRTPRALACVTLCLIPLGITYPTTAILITQAAIVGIILTLLAGLLRVLLKPEAAAPEAPAYEASMVVEPRSSTRSYITDPQPDSYLSAATTIALNTSDAGE